MSALKRGIKRLASRRKVRLIFRAIQVPLAWSTIRYLRLFDKKWYLSQYSGDRFEEQRKYFPLVHYLAIGRSKGLTPNPFFIGEYYKPLGWSESILDPLLEYVLRRNTWNRPTSLLFDPTNYVLRKTNLPPLALYLKDIRKADQRVYFDVKQRIQQHMMWSDIKAAVYEAAEDRSAQYDYRKKAEPVTKFDYRKEKSLIARYSMRNSDQMGKVSIVMPVWNRQELVKQAIESVQNQTFNNWELLVVDDGSTDSSIDVIRSYCKEDSRIKLYTPGHGGVCKARNHGLEQASGDWVAFLDSDNTWTKDFLQVSVSLLIEKKAKASYATIRMENNGNVRYRVTEPNPQLLETGNFVDLNALIVKRKLLKTIGYFDETLRRMVDYDLVIRVSKVTSLIYVPIIGVNYSDHEDLNRITTTESVSWDGVVKNNNFIDWSDKGKQRKKGLISIIVPVRGSIMYGLDCMRMITASIGDRKDVEIIISDASSSSGLNTLMATLARLDRRIHYAREPGCRDTVLAANYGFVRSKGDKIVILDQKVQVENGWLDSLVDGLEAKMIRGPLQLKLSRTIQSAGVEYHSDKLIPINILEDHPLSDSNELDDVFRVDALHEGCMAIHSADFAHLRGFNPLCEGGFFVQDLSLRLRKKHANAKVQIVKSAQVVNPDSLRGLDAKPYDQFINLWKNDLKSSKSKLWSKVGFDVMRYETVGSDTRRLRPVLLYKKQTGSYRWAIKISAPADDRRFMWGDLYYAEALAAALERAGQKAAIDYHDYHERSTSYLDDILLDLRGLDDTQPQEGKLNIMWVISHPEKITPNIVNKFDLVFAAGKKWADYMSDLSGKDIVFLPQCTDTNTFFPPEKANPKYRDIILFLGSSRNVLRPIVRDSIAAGVDLSVYGGGWEHLINKKYIKGTFVPNNELNQAYGSARVVLNDHWKDMRQWGFISNRIFDVLSSGGSIITDDVEGLAEVLPEELVSIYEEKNEFAELLKNQDSVFSPEQKHLYITNNHSFDARARTMVDSVKEYNK